MLVTKLQTTGNVFFFSELATSTTKISHIRRHFGLWKEVPFLISEEPPYPLSHDMKIHILPTVLYTFVWN